jgi:hypothetical protein
MRTRFPLYTLVTALVVPALLSAQEAPMGPPPIAQIYREVVKPGKVPAHEKLETEWTRALANAKFPVNFIAISSLTGPAEAWFLSGYASWAEYEKINNEINGSAAVAAVFARYFPQEADMLADWRGMVARFRDDLSYLPGKEPLGTMRYFSITRTQIRPGHVGEFEEARKMIKAAHEKAKLSDGFVIYEVTSGAPAGTFLTFVARKSLAEIDQGAQIHGADYMAALGGDSAQKKLAALASSGTINAETNQFAFSPAMSYPSKETVAADPAFWTPKPAMAAPKKPEPKKP